MCEDSECRIDIVRAPNENHSNSETQLLYKQAAMKSLRNGICAAQCYSKLKTQISQANSNDFVNNIIIIPSCLCVVECRSSAEKDVFFSV